MHDVGVTRQARQRAEEGLVHATQALEVRSQELARSLAMTRATIEASTDGILATDAAGNITLVNENMVEMWRLPAEVLDAARRSAAERRIVILDE